MRARRVAIMLAITAISALTLFLVTLLDGPANAAVMTDMPGSSPDTLDAYLDLVAVDAAGDGNVSVTVVLGRVSSMDLLLPWQNAGGRDHQIERGPAEFAPGPDGSAAPIVGVLGLPHWNLRLLPGAAPGDTIVVSAVVDGWYDPVATLGQFGVHAIDRTWVNSSRFVLRDFRLGLALPPGLLVETVGATTPAFNSGKSPRPPFTVARDGNRGTFEIRAASLPPTGRAAFKLEARPAHRGFLPLIIGALLAVLYLIFYRDMLDPTAGR